jgi:hypothetical protein
MFCMFCMFRMEWNGGLNGRPSSMDWSRMDSWGYGGGDGCCCGACEGTESMSSACSQRACRELEGVHGAPACGVSSIMRYQKETRILQMNQEMQDLNALYNDYLKPTFRFDKRRNTLTGAAGSYRRFSVLSCISFKAGMISEISEATDRPWHHGVTSR